MDVREKLVELLTNSPQLDVLDWTTGWEEAANYLIAHGVTVQEWIPVKDRLPQEDGAYLVTTNSFGDRQSVKFRWFAKDGEMVDAYDLAGQKDVWYLYDIECGYVSNKNVNHWMPLPQPTRGK